MQRRYFCYSHKSTSINPRLAHEHAVLRNMQCRWMQAVFRNRDSEPNSTDGSRQQTWVWHANWEPVKTVAAVTPLPGVSAPAGRAPPFAAAQQSLCLVSADEAGQYGLTWVHWAQNWSYFCTFCYFKLFKQQISSKWKHSLNMARCAEDFIVNLRKVPHDSDQALCFRSSKILPLFSLYTCSLACCTPGSTMGSNKTRTKIQFLSHNYFQSWVWTCSDRRSVWFIYPASDRQTVCNTILDNQTGNQTCSISEQCHTVCVQWAPSPPGHLYAVRLGLASTECVSIRFRPCCFWTSSPAGRSD